VILNKGFGYSEGRAQLLTFPPYACAAFWIMFCSYIADRFKTRGPILVFNVIMYIIGVSLTGFVKNVHARYGGVFLGVMGITANIPTQWAYQHNNMVGQSKKALTIACMIMGGAFGGIIAGNVFQTKDSPDYISGLWICIAFQVRKTGLFFLLSILLINCQILYLVLVLKNFVIFYVQNKRADRGEIVIEGQPGFRYTY
jgi:hypothetical protein